MDTLLRQRRAEEHRHIGRKWQTILDLLLEFHHRIRLFGDRIPFVHEKEQALPCLVDVADDLLILLRQLIDRIQYKDRHITVIDGTDRTDDAVFFQRLIDLALLSHARCIDQDEGLSLVGPERIDRISRRPHFIRHERAFIAQKRIDQGGLPDIRASYDGRANDIFRLLLCLLRESFRDAIQKLAEGETVHCGDPDRIPQPQRIEFVYIHLLILAVHFIDSHDDRLPRAAQDPGDDLII